MNTEAQMNKTEKVRIELTAKQNPPVKYCNSKNKPPMSENFKLVPKYIPFLSQFIKEASWNCAEKTINIEIKETAEFDSYNWFGGINKRMSEAQKSSFVDLDQDSLLLIFMDECDKEVASIKFCGLQLVKHFCYLSKKHQDSLCHSISIHYTECEMIPKTRTEEDNFRRSYADENIIVDEEWQEVTV